MRAALTVPTRALRVVRKPPQVLAALAEDLRAAHSFAEADKADATRRSYRATFDAFAAYCRAHDEPSLPAAPAIVAAFLSAEAGRGLSASSIATRVAGIRYAHLLAGHDPAPTDAEVVKSVVRGIRRTIGTAQARKAPATGDVLAKMLATCPATLRGKRDRALLALGMMGAFRRSELAALHVADLVETPQGFRVLIRSSKTDQERAGQTIFIPRGKQIKAVDAVRAWLDAARIVEGPIFRAINRGGRVGEACITPQVVASVVKEAAEKSGLDPKHFGGHSLRAGFITTAAARENPNLIKIMDQSRHRSVETVRGYIRDGDGFRNHAGEDFA
jgi:integrase